MPTPADTGDDRAVVCPFAGAALLAVLVIGVTLLSRATRFPVTPGSIWINVASGLSAVAWLAGATVVVLMALGIVRSAVSRARARNDPDQLQHVTEPPPMSAPAKVALLLVVLCGPALIVVALIVLTRRAVMSTGSVHVASSASSSPRAPAPTPGLSAPQSQLASAHLGLWGIGGVVVLLLGLAIVFGLVRRRHRSPAVAHRRQDSKRTALIRMLSAGVAAATVPLDPRAAVLACYRAMEEALTETGLVRHDAETPNDLLLRAAGGHLVPLQPARRLCRLFDEARFSDHPLGATQRDAAILALEEVREGLEVRP